MAQPFTFPPPPPPPPKKDSLPPSNSLHAGYSSAYGYNARGGGGGFSRGRGRGGATRGRGFSSTGRWDDALNRGDYRNRETNKDQGIANHFYNTSQSSTYGSQHRQQSFPPPYHGQKRPYSAAFNKPANPVSRPQAPPAVPSFGGAILPTLASNAVLPPAAKKKPQKHNQLGLTPSTHENESSSDEGEEAKLANSKFSTTGSNPAPLSFEYRGRTSTLQTAADIAAWIAERRKRFPTAAKAEAAREEAQEKKRKWEESKKERAEAQRLERLDREKAKQEELRKKALESVGAKRAKKEEKDRMAPELKELDYELSKRAIKTEKLKRKLEKAQREAQRAQEALAKMQQGSTSGKQSDTAEDACLELQSKPPDVNTLVTSPAETEDDITKLKAELLKDDEDHLLNASDLSSEMSLSDNDDSETDSINDTTSSSGSSSISASLSESSDSEMNSNSDSAPEETTSKRTAPDCVPPPPRTTPSTSTSKANPGLSTSISDHPRPPCRNMLQAGRCHFGDRCRYSHHLPAKNSSKGRRKRNEGVGGERTGKKQKKSLYQVMVEKEIEAERREVLKVIVRMGERGMLGENIETTEAGKEAGEEVEAGKA